MNINVRNLQSSVVYSHDQEVLELKDRHLRTSLKPFAKRDRNRSALNAFHRECKHLWDNINSTACEGVCTSSKQVFGSSERAGDALRRNGAHMA